MEVLTKVVARQDANFKLSPSSSNETSINLANDIAALISDDSGEVTFTIYKEDFVKAVSAICLIPNVYHKKDIEPSKPSKILSLLFDEIKNQFGDYNTSLYTVNILNRDDGRSYINNLKRPNGFNLRSFLVEQLSVLHFIKEENGKLTLRVETLLPLEDVDRVNIKPELDPIEVDTPLQQIFYGAPGTGKSYTIDQITNESNSIRTTFHPDSDYAGFVGAYKPTMENVPINSIYGESVQFATGKNGHPGTEKKIVYKYVPQAFLKAYVAAWSDLENPHFLIIEEINRGNCAQIFGDLFQLLNRNNQGSSSYAIDADEDIAQFLREDKNGFALKQEGGNSGLTEEQREAIRSFVHVKDSEKSELIGEEILSGKKLLLPPNLYIWATMNTSDQSLFPIDSAFKRRWNWEYVPIETNPADKKTGELLNWKFEAGGKIYSWGDFLDFINPKIFKITLSEDKQMGYFFAKPDKRSKGEKLDLISEKVFVNKMLFYLWTDVFKDFDLTEEQFVYEENQVKKPYRFTDFFPIENNTKLSQFIKGLSLAPIEDDIQDADVMYDSEGDADLNDSKSVSARDYSKYSVNGKGYYSKSDAVVEVVKALIATIPEVTSAKLIDKIKSLNLSYTFVYSEQEYNYYLEQSNDSRFAKRYAELRLSDGELVYVYRGSTTERMQEIINGLNITDSGVTLEKIE